ncbi:MULTISPECIES: DegT/DnrJ/EryC1/StrS family aminotransferase [Streptomyces]|uniref:DegT/DnrJ/EryC1/StrS family aminotransferase n=1 Tax=Streptomyces desertarenae TaxID=2666184 RepID=A0ABW4PQ01_9ACTN
MTGGARVFDEPLHVGRPNVGDRARLRERIDGALDRLWFTNNGPLVREFEERVAELAGTRHCVAVSNATTGIQVAAKAVGIGIGDEVIVPSFTWVATPHALDWIGAVPVFCDVDEATGTADVAHVEKLIGPRTRGILGVHVFGHPCRIDELTALADRHGIPLLFDAAHALGCTYRGKPIGGFGAAEIFSFQATKFVNSFEGGAIVTDDDELADRARAMRHQGLNPDHEITGSGTVARMHEISAAMGLTSLEAADTFTEVNRRNHRLYEEELSDVPGIRVRRQAAGELTNCQYVVIEVDAPRAGLDRDTLNSVLHRHNVLARPYFSPGCHDSEPYRSDPARHAPDPLPRTEALTRRVLSLPTGMAVGPAEVAGVCAVIREAVSAARSGAADGILIPTA